MCVFVWRLPFQRDVVLRSWPNRIPRAKRSSFTTENDLLHVSHKETRSKNNVSVIRSRRKPSDPVQCSCLRYVANVSNTVYYMLVKKTMYILNTTLFVLFTDKGLCPLESSIIFKLIYCVLLNSPCFQDVSNGVIFSFQ